MEPIVFSIQDYCIKNNLHESEVLYRLLDGSLKAGFFCPSLWVVYHRLVKSIQVEGIKIPIWSNRKSDILSGLFALPVGEVKEILKGNQTSLQHVKITKFQRAINIGATNRDFERVYQEVDEQGEDVYPIIPVFDDYYIDFLLRKMPFLRRAYHFRSRAIENHVSAKTKDKIFAALKVLSLDDDFFIWSNGYLMGMLALLSNHLKIDNNILTKLEDRIRESDEYKSWYGYEYSRVDEYLASLSDIKLFDVLSSDELKEIFKLSNSIAIKILEFDENGEIIQDVIVDYRDYVIASAGSLKIDHNEAIDEDQEAYKELFPDENLEDLEISDISDEDFFAKYNLYTPPKLSKNDLLIFNPEIEFFKFSDEEKSNIKPEESIFTDPDDIELEMADYVKRFIQDNTNSGEQYKVDDLADLILSYFGSASGMTKAQALRYVRTYLPEKNKLRGRPKKEKG